MTDQNSIALITDAAAFAAEAHRTQKRKASEVPYVNHLARVAAECARAGLSPEAVAAAYLHDVVEDTPVTLDELAERFSPRIVELVRLLTKWWSDHAPEGVKRSEKPKYYGAILGDGEAMAIKLLDRADNLRDMRRDIAHVERWAARYHEKTAREIAPLLEACPNPYAREAYRSSLEELGRALRARRDGGGGSPGSA